MNVSVIIPHYNVPHLLPRAVASVAAQGDVVQELIVIDDGSDEENWELAIKNCSQYKFQTEAWYRHAENRGQGFALNAGLSSAECEVVAFLDADDEWTGNKLELQLRVLEAPDVDAVVGHAQELEVLNHVVSFYGPPKPARLMSALCIRRAALDRIGPFAEDLGAGMTIEWFARAEDAKANIVMLDDTVYLRHIHRDNYGIRHYDRAKQEYLNALRLIAGRRHAASSP